jgi:NADH:ubiquinone oxidoreductase subunit 5 (subunit L)/multisubunit Na+/H+ antiporter MnhA subunit
VVKLAVFFFLVRVLFFLLGSNIFLFFWQPFFLFVSAGSILFGGLGALLQIKLKRFVGYTSINQMGYLFLGISSGDFLGLQASFLYLGFYLIMGFTFFSILLYVSNLRTGKDLLFISEFARFGLDHRNLSIILAIVLFSMAGIPPLAGFFGKFFLFFSVFKAGNHSLLFLGLLMNIVSTFYYLRIIKSIFFVETVCQAKPYTFFVGTNSHYFLTYSFILLVFFGVLVLAPFFLNKLLFLSGEVAFWSTTLTRCQIFVQHTLFKRYFKAAIKKKKKKTKKRLAFLYLVSTRNSTIVTFVDYKTMQILSACHIGHVLNILKLDRVHRRSLEAHKIYGAELRYVLDRYFFKEKYRILRRARRERPVIKGIYKIVDCQFKFLVYFKGPAKYRRVVIKEFTKRFRREKVDGDPDIWNQYYVIFFSDITSTPHNGCRSRKVQRTKLKRKPKIFRKSNAKKRQAV